MVVKCCVSACKTGQKIFHNNYHLPGNFISTHNQVVKNVPYMYEGTK